KECLIRISKSNDLNIIDQSDYPFVVDNTKPHADMESPTATTDSITWTCTEPEDFSPPVEYYFQSRIKNGTFGNSQLWGTSNEYTVTNLSPNTVYEAHEKARDNAEPKNEEDEFGNPKQISTLANQPGADEYSHIGHTGFHAHWTLNGNPGNTLFEAEVWKGTGFEPPNSTWVQTRTWQTGTTWEIEDLIPNETYNVRVRAKNWDNMYTEWVELGEVMPGDPKIFIDKPNGGEYVSGMYTITWHTVGNWDVNNINILYSDDGGETFRYQIVFNTPNTHRYEWNTSELNIQECKIIITKTNNNFVYAISEKPFIVDNTKPEPVVLHEPVNGSVFYTQPVTLDWKDSSDTNGVVYDLELTLGGTPVIVKENLTQSYYQLEETLPPGDYQWHVRARDPASNTTDWSQQFLLIIKQPELTLLSPNSTDNRNGMIMIEWISKGFPAHENITIEYSNNSGRSYDYTIVEKTENDGVYEWDTEHLQIKNCRIKVSITGDPSIFDTSDNDFTVTSNTSPEPEPHADDDPLLYLLAGETSEVRVRGGANGYVNPMQGETARVYFHAEEAGTVTFQIYTMGGSLIWEKQTTTTGSPDSITWDCMNTDGTMVSSGVYIVYVKAPGITTTRKIAIVK
ncbi:MAG: T9SS type A sorting domain-containing protein, partial [Elusimicrobia bacterium]|nr:T9SS type A sorting domain-containing protein [Elusimicrobiota bacterium]